MATISTAARNAAADGVVGLLDGGTGAGNLKFYTGSKPAGPDTAASGSLLATLALSATAFGAAASGVATAAAITSATAGADGTAGYCRWEDGDGNGVMDWSVSATGGGGEMQFAVVDWHTGDTIAVSSATWTQPAGS